MAENRKAIIISTGMDNIQLLAALKESEVATGVSLERIKGLYTKFSEQQARLESAKNDQSLAKLKATDDLKLAEMERFFATQKAMYEKQAAIAAIGGGSIPANMIAGAEGATGAFAIGGGAKIVEKEAVSAAKEMHGSSSILRETAVLFREGFRGNFTRMIGSATLLAQYLGALALVAGTIGAAIGTGINQLFGGTIGRITGLGDGGKGDISDWWGWFTAKRNAAASQKDLERLEKFAAERKKKDERIGDNRAKALEDLQEQSEEINRKDATTPQARYIEDTQRLMQLQAQLNQLSPDSPEWLEKRKEWNTEYLKQLQDIHDEQTKTADDKKKQQEEESEKQKELATLEREKGNLAIQFQADEQKQSMQFGTVSQIAQFGWQWSPREGWQRTEAGAMARELENLEGGHGQMGWQLWNRLHGNIELANQQASRESFLKRTLGEMGFLPKDEKFSEMTNHLKNLNAQVAAVTVGKTLAVTIADVAE
jgi:hypothetical protein